MGAQGALVLERLIEADADIVCLQEVDHYRDWSSFAMRAHGYAGLYREDEWSLVSREHERRFKRRRRALLPALEARAGGVPFSVRAAREQRPERRAGRRKSVSAVPRALRRSRDRVRAEVWRVRERHGDVHRVHSALRGGEDRGGRDAANAAGVGVVSRTETVPGVLPRGRFFDIGEGRTTDSARVRGRDIPIVFAGDLNARPDEPRCGT